MTEGPGQLSGRPGQGKATKILTRSGIAGFRRHIAAFYRDNKREFPWRDRITPYRILVSEIMLQQTGVERVIKKFTPFVDRFPDFNDLAAAPLNDIIEAWQGLGYNRRALSLKKIAGVVVDQYAGALPDDGALLREMPGIGEATAGSILAFAFNLPSIFIETNIRRVFIHYFFPEEDRVTDKEIIPLVEATIDGSHPRDWYYALMDYGTYLGTIAANPNRKSAHYSRQSRFQDSDRQMRGIIVRLLTGGDGKAADDIAGATGCERQRLTSILNSLVKDGLVSCDSELYRIA
jgi:A/G-specific adenine glycosylase